MQVKIDELNDMTQTFFLRLKHPVHICLPNQTAEECIGVLLDICSSNIVDHIIDEYLYYKASVYFVDEVEIIMKMLDNEAAPIEKVCVESVEEEKWKKLRIFWKEATSICIKAHK